MHRFARLGTMLAAVLLLAIACSGDDESSDVDPEGVDSTTSAAPTTSVTSTSTASAAASSTTSTSTTSTSTSSSTTTTTSSSTTTMPADTEAPSAPAGVSCATGAGSSELSITWDAPPAEDEVTNVRVYERDPGGQFQRVAKLEVGDPNLTVGQTEWNAYVEGITWFEPRELAVTHGDAAGNESGWNPIDFWVSLTPPSCNTGAPDTPVIVSAQRGGGSGEIDLVVTVVAVDVVDWQVEIDQGAGFAPGDLLLAQSSGAGAYVVTLQNVDNTVPASFRVRAVDGHGNTSGAGERVCPAVIGPADVC